MEVKPVTKKLKTELEVQTILDTSTAERKIRLIKLPPAAAKSWSSHPSSDPHPVAKVVVSIDPLGASPTQTTLEMTENKKRYHMNESKNINPMCVFSEENNHGKSRKTTVEGCVIKYDMKPSDTNLDEIGKVCRERTNKSTIKNRQVKMIENDTGIHMRPTPVTNYKPTVQIKKTDSKRIRIDREKLLDKLIKMFEEQPMRRLKHLLNDTNQPVQFLKEILSELCVYNKRGINQGTYELKPEYKKSVDVTPAE